MQYGYREASENLKEQRIQYFLEHYHSKQEVLYRLPLNIPISSFWPELLNRRKAKATVLPLHNAQGTPYWFVLTEKMVAASERLSQEAISFSGNSDPYQMKMTSAMTKEMYFTSFVEGASVQIEEAMDFLNRGTEPENIMEQMIWNNRQAWELMVKNIYSPINEESVRFLAYVLTEGMDQCAENYRQNDQHPVAAMQGEDYEIPTAAQIPGLMNEYYAFMNNPEIHPLIKAPVGAAFLLVTRPFSEGNERLSRLITPMVLLRSGYGLYQDISLSAVIAKETWSYYQSMCEIMRSHNDGDLTYFMEYYLEMLVRAVDQKREHDQHLKEEAVKDVIGREQEMSRQSLQSTAPSTQNSLDTAVMEQPVDEAQTQIPFNVAPSINSMVPVEPEIESKNNAPPSVQETSLIPDAENPFWLLEQYLAIRKKVQKKRRYSLKEECMVADRWLQELHVDGITLSLKRRLQRVLKRGGIRSLRLTAFIIQEIVYDQTSFRARDYREKLHVSKSISTADFDVGKRYGLMKSNESGAYTIYEILTISEPSFKEEVYLSANQDVQCDIITSCMELGIKNKREREFLYMLLEEFGRKEFTTRVTSELFLMSIRSVNYYVKRLYDLGLLRRKKGIREYIYQITEPVLESIYSNDPETVAIVTENPFNEEESTCIRARPDHSEDAERIRKHLVQKHNSGLEYPVAVAG